MPPVTIASIRGAINDSIDKASKSKNASASKKVEKVKVTFNNFVDKIRGKAVEKNKKLIRKLNILIKKIQGANTPVKREAAKTMANGYGYTNVQFGRSGLISIIQRIRDDIALLGIININVYTFEISELPDNLAKFMTGYLKSQKIIKLPPIGKAVIEAFHVEAAKKRKVEILNVDTIEPLPLFIILGFLNDPDFTDKLQKKLNLDSDLMPKDYTMFENFNIVVKKTHVTGTTFNTDIIPSENSKVFKKIEPELQDAIDISKFRSIPAKLLEEFSHQIHEVNSIFRIIFDFGGHPKDHSKVWIGVFVKIFHGILRKIPSNHGKKIFAKYIIRSLNLLEIRKTIYSQDISKLAEKGTVSNELANIMKTSETIQGQVVQENEEPVEENTDNYNRRFENFFDDDELTAAFEQ